MTYPCPCGDPKCPDSPSNPANHQRPRPRAVRGDAGWSYEVSATTCPCGRPDCPDYDRYYDSLRSFEDRQRRANQRGFFSRATAAQLERWASTPQPLIPPDPESLLKPNTRIADQAEYIAAIAKQKGLRV